MAKRKKQYLNNASLLEQIKLSKRQGELTKEAEKMLVLLATEAIKKLPYVHAADRDDCLQFAILDLLKYWKGFNADKYTNAFAYYTEICKKGYAKGWNKLYPKKYANTLRMSGSFENDDSDGLYSLGY
jgi:hypothetical protein